MTLNSISSILDVRELPPGDRHRRVFQAFDGLAVGDAIELVNDHDPHPLYYQLQARAPGSFTWRYREMGPSAWRVEIGRTQVDEPATAGACCGGGCGGARGETA